MPFSFQILLYQACIDPILARLHTSVLSHVGPSDRVLDIACGTGALAMAIAQKARQVTGIDLSKEAIAAAKRVARRNAINNVSFEIHDAGDLSLYTENEFDIAVTSMSIHQFDAELAVNILAGMNRVARRLILVDYNHHMRHGWGRSLAWAIERLAGGDHYRNFRIYMKKGGILYFARQAGIHLKSQEIRGGGVFVVAV
ncbi:MAG: class I SAM-dependent methyltransferase [Bacteroidales bacterium]|nr:class I SAM-dependent methyltransferase [Bacteroidales bacterium]